MVWVFFGSIYSFLSNGLVQFPCNAAWTFSFHSKLWQAVPKLNYFVKNSSRAPLCFPPTSLNLETRLRTAMAVHRDLSPFWGAPRAVPSSPTACLYALFGTDLICITKWWKCWQFNLFMLHFHILNSSLLPPPFAYLVYVGRMVCLAEGLLFFLVLVVPQIQSKRK